MASHHLFKLAGEVVLATVVGSATVKVLQERTAAAEDRMTAAEDRTAAAEERAKAAETWAKVAQTQSR
jgi:hypothetical protein